MEERDMERRKGTLRKSGRLFDPIKRKMRGFRLTAEVTARVRWVLFVLAFLLLFLAFQMGDDWFVREFANYDWARSIGF